MKVVIDARSSLLGGGLTFACDLYWRFFFSPHCSSVWLILEDGSQVDSGVRVVRPETARSKFSLRKFIMGQNIDLVIFSGTSNFFYVPGSIWYCHNNIPFSKHANATFGPIDRAIFVLIRLRAFVTTLNVDKLIFTSLDSRDLFFEKISLLWINRFRFVCGRRCIQFEVSYSNLSGITRRFGRFPRWEPYPKKGKFEFVMVSSWRPYKRIDVFIEFLAFFMERSKNVEISIHFVGSFKDQTYSKKIMNHLRRLPALQYFCHEDIQREEVMKLLSKTDGFLFCSTTEAGSLAVVEALHVGTPCFVERSTSTPEYMGDYAHYFELKNHEEFEQQFRQFLVWVDSLRANLNEPLLMHESLRNQQLGLLGYF